MNLQDALAVIAEQQHVGIPQLPQVVIVLNRFLEDDLKLNPESVTVNQILLAIQAIHPNVLSMIGTISVEQPIWSNTLPHDEEGIFTLPATEGTHPMQSKVDKITIAIVVTCCFAALIYTTGSENSVEMIKTILPLFTSLFGLDA